MFEDAQVAETDSSFFFLSLHNVFLKDNYLLVRWEGGSGWGRHVNPRPFHFNV